MGTPALRFRATRTLSKEPTPPFRRPDALEEAPRHARERRNANVLIALMAACVTGALVRSVVLTVVAGAVGLAGLVVGIVRRERRERSEPAPGRSVVDVVVGDDGFTCTGADGVSFVSRSGLAHVWMPAPRVIEAILHETRPRRRVRLELADADVARAAHHRLVARLPAPPIPLERAVTVLARAATHDGGYRANQAAIDDVWCLLEDVSATAEHRVAALRKLAAARAFDSPSARTRAADVVEASAAPTLQLSAYPLRRHDEGLDEVLDSTDGPRERGGV